MGRFLSVDIVPGRPSSPQSWNRFAYSSNSPIVRMDPDGRKDIRTPEEKAMMADTDVLRTFGEASFRADRTMKEQGYAVVDENGDYTTTAIEEGEMTSVFVPAPEGAVGRFHTHRLLKVNLTKWTVPNEASEADEENAKRNRITGYIETPRGVIRVTGPGQSEFILDGKEFREYRKAARRAAREARKAEREEKKRQRRQWRVDERERRRPERK